MATASPNPSALLDGRFPVALLLGTLALAAITAYWPGLSGSFLFDDYANLNALGRYGPVSDWNGVLRYASSGIADPTGRPVAMLSFLLDANDWPADPYPFKRSNVLLHAINGMLLYAVLVALGKRVAEARRARQAALLGAAFWMFHPLWVSSVLYIVQRHAMLAAFFVLCGILSWTCSLSAFERGQAVRGWTWAIVAVPVCGLLAGLSKANGFLLPLLLLTLHVTVLRTSAGTAGIGFRRQSKLATWGLVGVPSACLLVFLGYQGWHAAGGAIHDRRPWSLAERIMSQPRALADYLHQLFVPGLDARGIFGDGFKVSTSLWEPGTTIPAIALLVALLLLAWRQRVHRPVLAAAVLFFFAGHAMESSVIPLELYFEHRNYLPAALIFWPLAMLLTHPGQYRRLATFAAFALIAVCAILLHAQARLWADPLALSREWATALPESARAQTFAASMEASSGRPADARARLEGLLEASPGELQYALTLLDLECKAGIVSKTTLHTATSSLSRSGIGTDMGYQWLLRVVTPGSRAACARVLAGQTELLVAAVTVTDPASVEQRARALRLQATAAMQRGNCEAALLMLNRRVDLQRRPEFAHEQVGLLATHCGSAAGLSHLDHYESRSNAPLHRMPSPMLRLRDLLLEHQDYWDKEWKRLRAVLEAEQ